MREPAINNIGKLPKGHIGYVPVDQVFPGQTRISSYRVDEKISQAKSKYLNSEGEKQFDHGQSLYPLRKAKKAIWTSEGIILTDGHHAFLSALHYQSETFPLEIISSKSKKGKELWLNLESKGLVFYRNKKGKFHRPESWECLKDDPNRFLVSLLAKKKNPLDESQSSLPKLWYKADPAPPFIEFLLANLLYESGVKYEYKWKDQIPEVVWEKIKDVFKNQVKKSQDGRLSNLGIDI